MYKTMLMECIKLRFFLLLVVRGLAINVEADGTRSGKIRNSCKQKDTITQYRQCGKPTCTLYENICTELQQDHVCPGEVPTSCNDYQRAGNTNRFYTVINSLTGTEAEAHQKCAKNGGALAVLPDLDIISYVRELVEKQMAGFNLKPNKHGLWIGGHYDSSKERFFWNDGTEIDLESELWYDGEPSTITKGVYNTECLLLYPSFGYKLGDYQCDPMSGPLLPLCECITR